jgi:hypothetical protein
MVIKHPLMQDQHPPWAFFSLLGGITQNTAPAGYSGYLVRIELQVVH